MKTNTAEQIGELTRKEIRDLQVLVLFTAVFCQAKHQDRERLAPAVGMPAGLDLKKYRFCPECSDFLAYACDRRMRCPLEPKPTCKHCYIHCYRSGHRERIREIMRFSGKRLIMRGRLDLLWHFLF